MKSASFSAVLWPVAVRLGSCWRRLVALGMCVSLGAGVTAALISTASVASATTPTTLYAAASGAISSDCSITAPCALQTALNDAVAGNTVALTTAGSEGNAATYYTGQFTITTAGTSTSAPLTIEPANGVAGPILDGANAGTVLSIGGGVTVVISGITVQHGNAGNTGGGLYNPSGGDVTLSDDTFSANTAFIAGGAIENSGGGILTVTGSTFTGNSATIVNRVPAYGGAIDNGQSYGSGSVTISESTFVGNTTTGDGGAISNGVQYGSGTLTVTGSTFEGNVAQQGGSSIVNGSHRGQGTVTVAADIFADTNTCNMGDTFDGHPHVWNDGGYNVAENTSCFGSSPSSTDNTVAAAGLPTLLGPLAGNGGPTQTLLLLAGNPALDIIPNPTAGLCPVSADQRGYVMAPSATSCDAGPVQHQSLIPQTIAFTSTAPTGARAGGPTYLPSATATSGLGVVFTIDPPSTLVCSLSAGVVTFLSAGTCTIDANQAGDDLWAPATEVSETITVDVALLSPQTIVFTSTAPTGARAGGTTYLPTATATSGLGVVFTIDPPSTLVCSLSAGVVTFLSAGTCTIDANQAGDDLWAPATEVSETITVDVALLSPQTIVFTSTAPTGARAGGTTYLPTATATSGLGVVFTIDPPSTLVCSLSAGVVTFLSAGTCTIDANQAGDDLWAPATEVSETITVDVALPIPPAATAPPAPPAPPGATTYQSASSGSPSGDATAALGDGSLIGVGQGKGALTVARYATDPVVPPVPGATGTYYDVRVAPDSAFTAVSITFCNAGGPGRLLYFWDGARWQLFSSQSFDARTDCVTAMVTATTTPTDGQLTGTPVAPSSGLLPPPNGSAPTPTTARPAAGYWEVGRDGSVFTYGHASFEGSLSGDLLSSPIVAMTAFHDGHGYWVVASSGAVSAFGDARSYGSPVGRHLKAPIVGMVGTADGHGYWEVASDGGVFAFGDARFFGSLGNRRPSAAVVGMAVSPDGQGYWVVASNGAVSIFGDARFYRSPVGRHLNAPIVGIVATTDGHGYWEVASDGGVFAFGDARFFGSLGNRRPSAAVVGMAVSPDGRGYWVVASNGAVSTFGDAGDLGPASGQPSGVPIVGVADLS